jgi:signal transduction histidine kinase
MAPTLSAKTTCGKVYNLFSQDPTIPGFAVLTGASPIGLVDRANFLLQFARPFGRELFERKSIMLLMEAAPLIVELSMSLIDLSRLIIASRPTALQTGFIVVENGEYRGIGTGLDLMRVLAQEMEIGIEELKAAEEHIIQSEKFALLGQLVAGVAHEINTPIGVGLTAASHLRERTKSFSTLVESNQIKRADLTGYLSVAEEASQLIVGNIQRAAELIQSFKQVAVDQTSVHRDTFPLKRVIADTVASLASALKKDRHTLVIECSDDIILETYPGPLTQVLTNLVMNALLHAFEDNNAGTIRIASKMDGDRVVIDFSDDGKGIPKENLPRIFDPFFTTKRGQGGSGLGLNIVYNLVTQTMLGQITCISSLGRGTRFNIRLPRTLPKSAASAPATFDKSRSVV